jgi:hypothetical protein
MALVPCAVPLVISMTFCETIESREGKKKRGSAARVLQRTRYGGNGGLSWRDGNSGMTVTGFL